MSDTTENKQNAIEPRRSMSMTSRGLQPENFDDLWRLATAIDRSGLAPKDMRTPETIFVALEMGLELGLPAMASLRQIAVINGRPSIWGDAALALCKASGELEDFEEYVEGDYEDMVATVKVKRRGFSRPVVQTFSVDDAKRAGLLGKSGPWQQYRARMLKLRARGFALRDTFADVLQGLYLAEEAQDIPPDEPKPRKVDSRAVTNDALAALPDHSDSSPAVTGVIKPPNDEPEAKTERMERPEHDDEGEVAAESPADKAKPEDPRRDRKPGHYDADEIDDQPPPDVMPAAEQKAKEAELPDMNNAWELDQESDGQSAMAAGA